MNQTLWEKTYNHQNLISAWNKVKKNGGSPGIDHITLDGFEQDLEGNLNILQEQLEAGNYTPLPVLRIYIDKENGAKRSIGIPAIKDRVVQQALLFTLFPIFEEEFLSCSFAYRPGRSALDALSKVEALIKDGFKWVLDGDIENFFDSIDHDLLLCLIAERVSNPDVLKLIKDFEDSR